MGTVFFALFLAAGLLFTGLLISEARNELATRNWTPTAARVVQSRHVVDAGSETPYRLAVVYEYTAGGTTHRGDAVGTSKGWTNDFRDVQRGLVRYPAGAEVTAYVDPANPAQAVLEPGSGWILAMLPLPLLFVVIGAGGAIAMWWRRPAALSDTAISAKAGHRRMRSYGAAVFFAVFTVVGAPLTWFFGVLPLHEAWQARSWLETPATVERGDILVHRGDDSTTYRLDILYRYQVGGQTYRSNAYDLLSASSSGLEGKRRVLEQHPVGREVICYVDPDDPTRAVLRRELGWMALFGLVPFIALAIGVGGLLTLAARAARGSSVAFPSAAREPATPIATEATTLTSRGTRSTQFLIMSGVAIFWTGISTTLLAMLIHDREWIGVVFLSLFVLVGLVLCGVAAGQFLALFNPQVRIALPGDSLTLGQPATLEWELAGNLARLQDFRLTLEGQERASYRQGTDNRTDTHTFRTIALLEMTDPARIMDGRGRAELVLPIDTMHSFSSRHNEVRWTLKATGRIHRWPDVKDEWPVQVRPARPAPAAAAMAGEGVTG